MIRKITIENYKSIEKLELELGRLNVFIGENGSGKSNVLEAIALASAASQDKLDNEFLATRGIRVTEPRFMRAAFDEEHATREIHIALEGEEGVHADYKLQSEGSLTHVRWVNQAALFASREQMEAIASILNETLRSLNERASEQKRTGASAPATPAHYPLPGAPGALEGYLYQSTLTSLFQKSAPLIRDFLIYAPENTALRTFQAEGQILPLGVKGEGLFAYLKALTSEPGRSQLDDIIKRLSLLDWFEGFEIPEDLALGERSLRIRDRYLTEGALFDQRSANEGFLFLLFYFTLFISPDTPSFFAIDNIDASLNPKLCSALTEELARLAKAHGKQAILTTHSPAVLDGLDLHDEDQRLLVVYRTKSGHTKVRRVQPPKPIEGEPPIRLSEAFLRGYLGGLPRNF
jgi:predicted ATPase